MSAGLLALAFALTAALYSLAGFAGGSTYLALLTLSGTPYAAVAPTALACNLVASAGNSWRYMRARLWRPRLLLPHMLPAIPMALLGGATPIGKAPFEWLAAVSLLVAGGLLLWRHRRVDAMVNGPPPLPYAVAAGAALGYLSGLIGIGGGIFLAPLLYYWRAGTAPEIAASCSLFILANSLAGLAGQWVKLGGFTLPAGMWWLPLAVLIGSTVGGWMSISTLSPRHIAMATAVLLLAASAELFHTVL